MSKISSKLQPFVIGGSLKPSTKKELDALQEEFLEVLKDLPPGKFNSLPKEYTYTARPCVFPILKTNTVELIKDESKTVRIPSYIAENEELLSEIYDGGKIGSKYYQKTHPNVVKTKDTERIVLKKDAIRVLERGYCEKASNTTQLDGYDRPAYKGDVTRSVDTNKRDLKSRFYKYKDGDTEEYYAYSSLAPDAPKKRIHFEEATFPQADEINETRVGIELEYSHAVDATRETLRNENYRNKWLSVHDGSIPRNGTEFVSIPFRKRELHRISDFMEFCADNGARINKSCGFHVHVGSPQLDFVSLTSVVLFCENIQEDLFKLVPDHRQDNRYCKRIDKTFRGFKKVKSNEDEVQTANIFYSDAGTDYKNRHRQSKHAVNSKRHYWLSIDRFFRFKNEPHKKTVEFRMHHATHNAEEFMQFVLLCYYIVQYGITKSIRVARNSTLRDFINWIPDKRDQRRIEDLLTSKKVLEKAI